MRRPRVRVPYAPLLLVVFVAWALLGPLAPFRNTLVMLGIAVAGLASAAYVVWRVHPAWTLSIALCLSVFAGNWDRFGVPGFLAPDRLLFVAGIAAVLFRAPPVRDRPVLSFGAAHWAMVLVVLWTVGSALDAGTLGERSEMFKIIDRLGVIPFFLFLVAPVVFDTERHRRILLGALVGLGAYLGFTALMETLGIRPLVFPSYIADSSIGTHSDRARGPFLEAVTNGAGLYVGGVGAAIALVVWHEPKRRISAAIILGLCFGGLLFTETRSVWLGGAVATVFALLTARELRRFAIPAMGAAVAVVALSIALVPGLSQAISERRDDDRTVWDRKNLATAAVNMAEDHPLTGVGWGRFRAESSDYFRLSQDYPQTAYKLIIHHVFLTYAAEIGLVGLGLWFTALALGVAAALRPTRRPEARLWQIGLVAYLVFFLVISNFVFAQVFPNTALWLLAGAAIGAAGRAEAPVPTLSPSPGGPEDLYPGPRVASPVT